MTCSPPFHIPGSFVADPPSSSAPNPTNPPPDMFRPPASNSASSSGFLAKSSTSLVSDCTVVPYGSVKRKRRSDDDSPRDADFAKDLFQDRSGIRPSTRTSDSLHTPSNARYAQNEKSRYVLAGQLDTPEGMAYTDTTMLEESAYAYSDTEYRRALGWRRAHPDTDSSAAGEPYKTAANGGASTPSSHAWSRTALEALGGVVGKVWEFCKAGAFRGFYAGGGDAYGYGADASSSAIRDPSPEVQMPLTDMWSSAPETSIYPQDSALQQSSSFTYVPANPPSTDTTPTRPSAKRRHVAPPVTSGKYGDEIRRSWVLVEDPASNRSARRMPRGTRNSAGFSSGTSTRTPRRPYSTTPSNSSAPRLSAYQPSFSQPHSYSNPRHTTSTFSSTLNSHTPRHSQSFNRISHTGSPSLAPRSSASFAAPRSPTRTASPRHGSPSRIPVPSTLPTPSPRPRRQTTTHGSPAPRSHRRTQSTASTASMSSPASPTTHSRSQSNAIPSSVRDMKPSPIRLDAEARQLAARRAHAERDADVRMEAFNAQLRAMIREGKEALGSRVEVEMEEWVDD